MDNETWKLLVGGLVTLCSTALGGALSFGGGWFVASRNSASNKELKEHEYRLAHHANLVKKRFEIYSDFEKIGALLYRQNFSEKSKKPYSSIFENKKTFMDFYNQSGNLIHHVVWLNSESTLTLHAIGKIVTEIEEKMAVENLTDEDLREIGIAKHDEIIGFAIKFLTAIQHDYLELHDLSLLPASQRDLYGKGDGP